MEVKTAARHPLFNGPYQLAALSNDIVLVLDSKNVWFWYVRSHSRKAFYNNEFVNKTVTSISVGNKRVLVATSTHIHAYTYGDADALRVATKRLTALGRLPKDVMEEVITFNLKL